MSDHTTEKPRNRSRTPFPKSIAKTDINRLPLDKFSGEIHLITTQAAAELAVQRLLQEKVLGFDTESRPSFRKGESYLPSLVQLSTETSTYLFQINRLGGIEQLKPLFTIPDLLKVGVALHDDIKKLKEISDFDDAGFLEVSQITKELGVRNTGLRSLAGIFLKVRVSKSAQVSNWARRNLNWSQITYAATDSWISLKLYLHVQPLFEAKCQQQATPNPET